MKGERYYPNGRLKDLNIKYDRTMIARDCDVMVNDRVLNGIRERIRVLIRAR